MSEIHHTCKNCGFVFTGQYCNQCGQKDAHRLDLKHVLHEGIHVITHADKGILALIPALLFRPGIVALDYVRGQRKKHFNIFQYLIIIVGIITFIMVKSPIMDDIFQAMNAPSGKRSADVVAVQTDLMSFVRRYFNFLLFALIPVFAFFSWLFFKKTGYNYAEHLVLQVAIQSSLNTYSLFLTLPVLFSFRNSLHPLMLSLSFLVLLGCYSAGNRQFFKVTWLQAAVKGVLIYICTYIIQIIMMIIAVFFIVKNRGITVIFYPTGSLV